MERRGGALVGGLEATHAEISCPNELSSERHERVARTREKDCLPAWQAGRQDDGVNALADKCCLELS